jgi:hypothetical protein
VYGNIYQRIIDLDSLGLGILILNKFTWLRIIKIMVGLGIKI